MRAAEAHVGAVICDSLPFSQSGTSNQARALRASGVDALACYLGVLSPARLSVILDAGLAYVPVSLAGEYENGPVDELAALKALGVPAGVTVWLDLEGTHAFQTPAVGLIAKIDAWAAAIEAAGYMPGLYVGVPQPLTSAELYALRVRRYWRGQGSIRDRYNQLAEPACGWTLTQMWPSVVRGGVLVDVNVAGHDYRSRALSWAAPGQGEAVPEPPDTEPALPVPVVTVEPYQPAPSAAPPQPIVTVLPDTVDEAQRRDPE